MYFDLLDSSLLDPEVNMSTDLSRNATVPLWGFVVIIAVGSIIVLGVGFFGLRYYIHRHTSDNDSIKSDPETVRKVTVRRGRMVPQSHYLSLTGSRYGHGAFTDDPRPGARSKSPFEWLQNVHTRSNSQMSQAKAARQHQTPEPTLAEATPRKHVPSPLRSAASFDSMWEKQQTYTYPTRPTLAHRASRTTNFSRPGLGMPSPSMASLPQIVEVSPHHSMISRRSKQSILSEKTPSVTHSELGQPHSPASMTGFGSRATSHAELSSTISEEPEHHPTIGRQRSQSMIPRPKQAHTRSRSKSLPRSPRPADNGLDQVAASSTKRPSASQTESTSSIQASDGRPSATQTEKRSASQSGGPTPRNDSYGRPSLPRLSRRSSSTLNSSSSYRAPGDADHTTGRLSSASVQALPRMNPTDNNQAYWESREDLRSVRRKSQKGKVLRKKSLKRAERTSMVN